MTARDRAIELKRANTHVNDIKIILAEEGYRTDKDKIIGIGLIYRWCKGIKIIRPTKRSKQSERLKRKELLEEEARARAIKQFNQIMNEVCFDY
jgi:hypothetical protein